MGGAGTKSGGSERKRDRRIRRVAFWPRSRRSEANGTRAKAKPAGVVKLWRIWRPAAAGTPDCDIGGGRAHLQIGGSASAGNEIRVRSERWPTSFSQVEVVSKRSPGDWNAAHQCLALAEASRSSLLSKSVRSSASSRSRSICGTSFTNAGLRVTESITAHKSRPGNFSIVYRIIELSLRNRTLASSGRGLLHSQERTFTGGGSTSVSCQ
jgi:hypothetical protein